MPAWSEAGATQPSAKANCGSCIHGAYGQRGRRPGGPVCGKSLLSVQLAAQGTCHSSVSISQAGLPFGLSKTSETPESALIVPSAGHLQRSPLSPSSSEPTLQVAGGFRLLGQNWNLGACQPRWSGSHRQVSGFTPPSVSVTSPHPSKHGRLSRDKLRDRIRELRKDPQADSCSGSSHCAQVEAVVPFQLLSGPKPTPRTDASAEAQESS